ncbi:serine hydrolase domain-containing protein [Brevibacterium sp. LE-L]|uniref:serine hydrolase domain-containing protein n=1 Tax=Brevibacterium sp. LE-L TaxID=3418557 RepID=UPI003CF452F4
MPVHGTTETAFEPLKTLLADALDTDEVGASLAVDINGETVVDLWGGYRDVDRTLPWTRDTIVNIFSTTKNITALAILVLADGGLIDLDAPVATYWPEFAANGKESVLVRHLLGHASGVSGWEQPVTVTDLYDLPTATARLADQAPWWEPGTAAGYHALTFGHLLGELIRPTDGRSLTDFVAEELAIPLNADVQIGARKDDWDRIAPVIPPPPLDIDLTGLDMDSVAVKTMTGPTPDADLVNTPGWRNAEIGAGNGHANARGLVDLLRTISLGGNVDGHRLLSKSMIDRIFDVQADGPDLVNGAHAKWGTGFGLTPSPVAPFLPTGKVAWWGGWGGSIAIVDLDHGVTFAFVPNKMGDGGLVSFDRLGGYLDAIYTAL